MEDQVVEELKALMDRAQALMDQAEPTILRNVLDDKRLATVQQLYSQCTDCDDIQEKELRPLQKKRKKASGAEVILGGPRDPWKRITNLSQLPKLANHVSIHIQKYPDSEDAEKFLRTLALTSDCGEYDSKHDLGNAFMARYAWTQRVERRDEQVHVLQLFNDLFWFDMMQLLRPKGTGRVGGVMRDELDKFIAPLDFEFMKLEKDVVIANVGDWSIRGSKINKLCNYFGPGVILILHKELSRSFLEGRFTASGDYFEGAIDRLDTLGLKDYADTTGAGTLAQNIRTLLIKPFRDAYRYAEQDRQTPAPTA
ncbi:Nn.00g007410.m01.CDS01 [Neocucurbitaria sp. VM-36]